MTLSLNVRGPYACETDACARQTRGNGGVLCLLPFTFGAEPTPILQSELNVASPSRQFGAELTSIRRVGVDAELVPLALQ